MKIRLPQFIWKLALIIPVILVALIALPAGSIFAQTINFSDGSIPPRVSVSHYTPPIVDLVQVVYEGDQGLPMAATVHSATEPESAQPVEFVPVASSYRISDVQAMYEANARRPLGGLFAKGFTRTFTLMGGWNFADTELPALSAPGSPTTSSFRAPVAGPALLPSPENNGHELKDTGFVISGAMGRRHSNRLRSEIEFAIRENDLSTSQPSFFGSDLSAEVRAYSLMKNVIVELPTQTRFTPYGGAGIGISWVDVEAAVSSIPESGSLDENDTAFTWQAIGGVSTIINKATDFVVEYRYLGTGEVELDSIGELPYQANNLFLGLKLEY